MRERHLQPPEALPGGEVEAAAASVRSAGTVFSDWYRLNAMFQAWLVKIAKIAASSSPSTRPGNRPMKNTTVKVRKPEDRHRLQDVEHRDQDQRGAAALRRGGGVE